MSITAVQLYIGTLLLAFTMLVTVNVVMADPMQSNNYRIQSDSVNFSGNNSTSTSYTIEDTLGEVATGFATSTNYSMNAGYQQMHEVYIAVTAAADVSMSPAIGGVTGGTANGQTSFTVTTDDQAGYTATIAASTSPALHSTIDSFADYTPAGAAPDFTFTNAATASSFAFTPEGNDIDQRYKDNGGTCNAGSADTADACWDGLSTVAKTILTTTAPNHPNGTVTALKFRAASGSSHIQTDGAYFATTTVTVIPL